MPENHDTTTWILVADEGVARCFEVDAGADPREVERIVDDDAHADARALASDAQGRRAGGGKMQGTATTSAREGDDPERQAAVKFARRVVELLVEAHRGHRFDKLRIAAAPRFLGLLRSAMPKELERIVADSIDKDLVHLQPHEIAAHLPASKKPLDAG